MTKAAIRNFYHKNKSLFNISKFLPEVLERTSIELFNLNDKTIKFDYVTNEEIENKKELKFKFSKNTISEFKNLDSSTGRAKLVANMQKDIKDTIIDVKHRLLYSLADQIDEDDVLDVEVDEIFDKLLKVMDRSSTLPIILCGIQAYSKLNSYKNISGFEPNLELCKGLGLLKCIIYWENENFTKNSLIIKLDPRFQISQEIFESNITEFGNLTTSEYRKRKRHIPKASLSTTILKNALNVDTDREESLKDSIKSLKHDEKNNSDKETFLGCIMELEIIKDLEIYSFDLRETLNGINR